MHDIFSPREEAFIINYQFILKNPLDIKACFLKKVKFYEIGFIRVLMLKKAENKKSHLKLLIIGKEGLSRFNEI